MAPNKLFYLFTLFIARLPFSLSGQVQLLDSVPDLERSMYKVVDGYPCVRLLNLSGEIGCSNPARQKIIAPIVRYGDTEAVTQTSAVLLSPDEVQSFFNKIERDRDFAKNVGGILVEAGTMTRGFSPAEKFPQAKFAPYDNVSYEWNPNGSGIMWNSYNFPVFLLSQNGTSTLKQVATMSEKNKKASSFDVAEFHLVMQTTKAGTHDSESCLKAGTCLPLGGHSVWSSLPPINEFSDVSKPIIMVVAAMDSASFFRDQSLGADSHISGLVALLAAADALSRCDGFKNLKKQVVFMAFTGEAWGFLGSRRFLYELELQSDAVKGLYDTSIETVIEIGSVGKGFSGGTKTFFAHKARDSLATNETLNALQHAHASLRSVLKVSTANTSNPGIPPSSLMTFLKQNPRTSGIVLEDFDTSFSNEFYHSHLDDISNINSTSVVVAASIVARSLYILASDTKNASTLNLNAVKVNVSLVEELLNCLLKCDPGLSCGLVQSYISPSSTCPSNYVGVVIGDPSSPPHPGYSSDISRFIWNFLADRTSMLKENATSSCQQGCSDSTQVCIGAETEEKGVCVRSSTRYVPAYSTRLKYESGTWTVLPANSSDPMGSIDPIWTESNWDVIGLRVYKMQDAAYDRLILLAGFGVTGFSYICIVIIKAFIAKSLKRD